MLGQGFVLEPVGHARQVDHAAERVWQPYVLANVWRDFGATATTMFGVDAAPLLEQATFFPG